MGHIRGAREVPWKLLHLLGAFSQASCLVICVVLLRFLHVLKKIVPCLFPSEYEQMTQVKDSFLIKFCPVGKFNSSIYR